MTVVRPQNPRLVGTKRSKRKKLNQDCHCFVLHLTFSHTGNDGDCVLFIFENQRKTPGAEIKCKEPLQRYDRAPKGRHVWRKSSFETYSF